MQDLNIPAQRKWWYYLTAWWFFLTAPPNPPVGASLEARERVRKGRVLSISIFILFLFTIPSVGAALTGPNKTLLPNLGVLMIVYIISAILNRSGRIEVAGLFLLVLQLLSGMFNIVTTPGGISPDVIPLFFILLIPVLISSAVLPPILVFFFAITNVLFSWYAISFLPHTPNLNLSIAFANGVFLPATLQGTIACLSFISAYNLNKSIVERDRAEEIARLQQHISEQTNQIAAEKVDLDRSIELITQVQTRAANGDLSARVPLDNNNVLWSVAGTLNNLIARLQRVQEAEKELMITQMRAQELAQAILLWKAGKGAPRQVRTGTVIDPIIMALFSSDAPSPSSRSIEAGQNRRV